MANIRLSSIHHIHFKKVYKPQHKEHYIVAFFVGRFEKEFFVEYYIDDNESFVILNTDATFIKNMLDNDKQYYMQDLHDYACDLTEYLSNIKFS